MTGFLQKLGILAEDDGPLTPPAAEGAARAQTPVQSFTPAAKVPNASASASVTADSTPAFSPVSGDPSTEAKVIERLTKALTDANLPGLDFFEFQKALKNAHKTLPGADEATRYSVAFGTLAAVGDVTPDAIASTADHYIKALDEKQASFTQYIEGQVKERVDAKRKDADEIKAKIQAKNEQIKALSDEIVQLTQASVEAKNAAAQAKAELEAYAQSFCDIKERFVQEIQQAKQKFVTYIMSGNTGR